MYSKAGVFGFPTTNGSLPEAILTAATIGPASGIIVPGFGLGNVSSSFVAIKRQFFD